MEDAHTKTAEEVTHYFGVDGNVGLTEQQVLDNRAKYGPNGMFSRFSKFSKTKLHKIKCAWSITRKFNFNAALSG